MGLSMLDRKTIEGTKMGSGSILDSQEVNPTPLLPTPLLLLPGEST